MQVYKVIPSNPNVIMVRNTLAVYGGLAVETRDIGTLCQAAGNKWAKFKPVNFPHPTALEAADIRVAYPNWYRGFNGACGLNILSYTTMSAMFTALRAGTFGWDYVKPTGGIGVQPFRLLDFVGYDVEAQPPIVADKLAAKYYISSSSVGASATVRSPGETELTLSDLGNAVNLGNCYFGAAISKVGTTTYKYITETSTIAGGGGGGVNIPVTGLTVGNYNIVFFLSTVAHGTLTDINDGTYVPLPTDMIQTIELKLTDFVVAWGGNTYWDANKTYFELVCTNEAASQRSMNGCLVRIKYADNKTGPDLSGETSFEIHSAGEADGVIVVPGNTTLIISVDFPVSGVDNPVLSSLPLYDAPDNRGGWIFFTNTTNTLYNTDTEIGSLE